MMNNWDLAPSVAFTCLLEFPWYAKNDERAGRGLSDHLVNVWKARAANGDTIDCLALAREIEQELRDMHTANAARLGITLREYAS